VVEAFPEETAPRFLVRDRDRIYGERFRRMVKDLIEEVVTAARSPWQNPYAERLIGSRGGRTPPSIRAHCSLTGGARAAARFGMCWCLRAGPLAS
jgi:hypothetical protein